MASAPYTVGERRASAPPVVLPITSRGLELTDRVCWIVLAAAMGVAAALILYLNRGTVFYFDELTWLYESPGMDTPGELLRPHGGHLIATTRLVFKAVLETVGLEYAVFRVIAVASVLLSAGLFYALAKRMIGGLPALAPTLLLLFLGSAWQHVVMPIGFPITFSVATGLAALLMLDRGDRRGDVAACLLLVVSVLTYTTGLAFLVGVAISVLLAPERRRRSLIFLVPLVLYGAWFLWSLSSPGSAEGEASASNVLLIPNWIANSMAAVMAGLSGLGYDFSQDAMDFVEPEWGRVLAAVAIGALALRVHRGRVPSSVWAFLGIALAYWTLGALASGINRTPESVRYMYVGSVAILLVAAAALPPIRFSKRFLTVLFVVLVLCLGANLALLRNAGNRFSDYSAGLRARFAALEIARDHVDPSIDAPDAGLIEAPASAYFAVVDRYGSVGFSHAELERQSENIREETDRVFATELGLRLDGSRSQLPVKGCDAALRGAAEEPILFELPRTGATLRAQGPGPATVTLGRFGDLPSVELGSLSPGRPATLRIPPDASPRPWRAAVAGASSVEVCALR